MHSLKPLLMALAGLLACFSGPTAVGQLTITNTDEETPATKIRQVSLSATPPPVMSVRNAGEGGEPDRRQLRIQIQFLGLDQATREAIYTGLGADHLESSINLPQVMSQMPEPKLLANTPTHSETTIRSATRVTQAVLDAAEVASILEMTQAATNSVVAHAPNLILLEGKKLELTDLVQRPFIVNHEKQDTGTKPILQRVEEGMRLAVVANPTTPDQDQREHVELGCEIMSSRIVDVRTDTLLSLPGEGLTVQVPIQQIATVHASIRLALGQTWLIDPHMTSTRSVRIETSVPLLSKIPYVGRSFTNVAVSTLNEHMIVLLRPVLQDGN